MISNVFGRLLSALVVCAVLMPILALAIIALELKPSGWFELLSRTRLQAFANTALLCLGVGVIVTILGTGLAWLVTAYDFKTKQALKVALLLPMAIPTYIMAYAYLDLMHPLGPIQALIRTLLDITNPKDLRLPDMRTLLSAILLLGFVLYPYVYISARAMFLTLPANLIESARSLGASSRGIFWRLAIPHARPGIVAGLGIALLETINDVGASEFLGVRTVTVELYTTWVSKNDLAGAAKLALLLLLLMLLFSLVEKYSRHRIKYSQSKNTQPLKPKEVNGYRWFLIAPLAWLPVLIGFVLPAGFLLYQVMHRASLQSVLTEELLSSAYTSLSVAAIVTTSAIVLAIVLVWVLTRLDSTRQAGKMSHVLLNSTKVGYFLPGTVLAIGLLMPFSLIDHLVVLMEKSFNISSGRLLMLGTCAGMMSACTIRFLGMAVSNIEAGFGRISVRLDQAARSLGRSSLSTLFGVHLPLLKPAIFSAALLIFVETMKELPTTLLLRPLNTETLATLLYADAARGNYEDGGTAALLIILLGVLPLIYLTRLQHTKHHKL